MKTAPFRMVFMICDFMAQGYQDYQDYPEDYPDYPDEPAPIPRKRRRKKKKRRKKEVYEPCFSFAE